MSGLPILPAEGRALIRKGRGAVHVAADLDGRGDWRSMCGRSVHGSNQCRVRVLARAEDHPDVVAEQHADVFCDGCATVAMAALRDPDHIARPH
jgi:hypothetical protein